MENIPPSYESATSRDYWKTVASYIHSSDLCAASRVSKAWHETFAPCLWGNPASHFGTENDAVYVALTRFKRTLTRARLSVRELTHTLHLPPAQSEIYDGPHPEWLRDVLEKLPNLQSLVVSRLPFFDHQCLLALRHHSDALRPSVGASYPTYALRLLIAAQCQNTTSTGLAEALAHFPCLVFLDLSNTLAARDNHVLSKLKHISNLQVLKLRNVHMRDEDVEVLAEAIDIRVRSLDLRGNNLTDRSVRTLLNLCFSHPRSSDGTAGRGQAGSPNAMAEDWPSGLARPDPAILDEFRDESFDEHFVRRLTRGIVSRLPFEDLSRSGITHLYIADNHLTVEGLSSLVKSTNLHVLNAGAVDNARVLVRPRSHTSTSPPQYRDHRIILPGVEKLTPVLERYASNSMTFLRLNHSVITKIAPSKEEVLSPGTFELSAEVSSTLNEMDAALPIYELAVNEAAPRYELPGDSMHIIVSPAVGEKPSLPDSANVRRGSVFAPEVVEEAEVDGEHSLVLTAAGLGPIAQGVNGIESCEQSQPRNSAEMIAGTGSMALGIAIIQKQRRELRASKVPHGLKPGMLPKLRTLVLTDVPCLDSTGYVADAFIEFIRDCALESKLATLEAMHTLGQSDSLGQQSVHVLRGARQIFSLQRIVLEMAPPTPFTASADLDVKHSPLTSAASRLRGRTKSSTEDADSEAFWAAQENDYSFFGDEECGLPEKEPGLHFPLSTLSEKMLLPTGDLTPEVLPTLQQPRSPEIGVDVIQELVKFRKGRKAVYENAVRMGERYVDGYWPGEVKVIRWHRDEYRHGSEDYYGNYFDKGICQ